MENFPLKRLIFRENIYDNRPCDLVHKTAKIYSVF